MCQTNSTEGDQPNESSYNVMINKNMHAEIINIHEAQGSTNDLMQFHSEAVNSVLLPTRTVHEQNNNAVTPPGTSNNMQMFDEPRVHSRGRM